MVIRDFYTEVLHISDEELIEKLLAKTSIRHIPKGELLVREGERVKNIDFLWDGILRGFFVDANGKEITDCIGVQRGSPAVSWFREDAVSTINIEALEDSTVISIPLGEAMELVNQNVSLLYVYNRLLQFALEFHWELKAVIHQYSAQQKYLWFLSRYPGLITRVKKKYVASFLGMSPVTLSRVRKELLETGRLEGDADSIPYSLMQDGRDGGINKSSNRHIFTW